VSVADVRLRVADQDVEPFGRALARFLEHRIRLAYTRRHAEEHFQPAAAGLGFLLLDLSQQAVGVGACIVCQVRDLIIPVSACSSANGFRLRRPGTGTSWKPRDDRGRD
jgi:hypothetical protein